MITSFKQITAAIFCCIATVSFSSKPLAFSGGSAGSLSAAAEVVQAVGQKRKKPQLIAPPGGLAVQNAAATLTPEQKAKIEQVNKQLKSLGGNHNWKKAKEIITKSVEEGVHPDLLVVGFGHAPLVDTVFYECKESDIDFARFLLRHGANPNQDGFFSSCSLLNGVKTPAMAQLLWDYGANEAVEKQGLKLLCNMTQKDEVNVPMLTWYIEHGVDVNGVYDGETPLHTIAFFGKRASFLHATQILMQAGASLSTKIANKSHCMNGYTVPQIMKSRLEKEKLEAEGQALLGSIRTFLSAVLHNRHERLQQDVTAATSIIPELVALIRCYYESTYEELENEPYPKKTN